MPTNHGFNHGFKVVQDFGPILINPSFFGVFCFPLQKWFDSPQNPELDTRVNIIYCFKGKPPVEGDVESP